jgi:thioester reductase-like protein
VQEDLLHNPETPASRRGNGGTSSRGGTFATPDFGSSVNQYDARRRQREAQQAAKKTPQQKAWDESTQRYYAEKAAEKQREADREQQRQRENADREKRQKTILEGRQTIAQFRTNEILLEGIIADHGITPEERRALMNRLVALGNIFNFDAATIFYKEIELNRKR